MKTVFRNRIWFTGLHHYILIFSSLTVLFGITLQEDVAICFDYQYIKRIRNVHKRLAVINAAIMRKSFSRFHVSSIFSSTGCVRALLRFQQRVISSFSTCNRKTFRKSFFLGSQYWRSGRCCHLDFFFSYTYLASLKWWEKKKKRDPYTYQIFTVGIDCRVDHLHLKWSVTRCFVV